jgi:hypothetical protein
MFTKKKLVLGSVSIRYDKNFRRNRQQFCLHYVQYDEYNGIMLTLFGGRGPPKAPRPTRSATTEAGSASTEGIERIRRAIIIYAQTMIYFFILTIATITATLDNKIDQLVNR